MPLADRLLAGEVDLAALYNPGLRHWMRNARA